MAVQTPAAFDRGVYEQRSLNIYCPAWADCVASELQAQTHTALQGRWVEMSTEVHQRSSHNFKLILVIIINSHLLQQHSKK